MSRHRTINPVGCYCFLLMFVAAWAGCVGFGSSPIAAPGLRVAVMPFDGNDVPLPVRQAIRLAFVNHLSCTDYDVLDPFEVERARPGTVDADLAVEVLVQQLSREADGLKTRAALTLYVSLRDLRTGQVLWKRKQKAASDWFAPETPEDAADVILSRLYKGPGLAVLAAADAAAERVVDRRPVKKLRQPLRVNSLRIGPRRAALAPGSTLEVEARAPKRLRITASLASGGPSVQMQEVTRGVYRARLAIAYESESELTAVKLAVDDPGIAPYIDPMHPMRIDATPPAAPSGLNISTLPGAVRLEWEPDPEALSYRIIRRIGTETLLIVGEVHNAWFVDSDPRASASNAYRVVAVDAAGNASVASDEAAIELPPTGPTTFPPRFTQDQTILAFGSPYLLPDDVLVSKGVTLTLEPGTIVHGMGNELRVRGTLLAMGTNAHTITFRGGRKEATPGSWQGLYFDGAGSKNSRLSYCTVQGATRGVTCAAVSPEITHCEFVRNVSGVECVSGAAPMIERCRFISNLFRAVNIRLGQPRLLHNEFIGNDRVTIEPQTEPVDLNDNWWDSLDPVHIRSRVDEPSRLTRFLDYPPPGGTPVNERALAFYERALAARPVPEKTRYLLGAVEADRSFIRGYVELAFFHSGSKTPENAIKVLQQCVDNNPANAQAWYHLGRQALELGDRFEAYDALLKAVELDPQLLWAHLSLAVIAAEMGRLDEAFDRAAQAVRAAPDSDGALRLYAELAARQGRLVDAQRAMSHALELSSGEALSWAGLGAMLLEFGREQEAKEAFDNAVKLRPHNAYLRILHGAALVRTGDTGAGLDEWREAVRLRPEANDARQLDRIIDRAGR